MLSDTHLCLGLCYVVRVYYCMESERVAEAGWVVIASNMLAHGELKSVTHRPTDGSPTFQVGVDCRWGLAVFSVRICIRKSSAEPRSGSHAIMLWSSPGRLRRVPQRTAQDQL